MMMTVLDLIYILTHSLTHSQYSQSESERLLYYTSGREYPSGGPEAVFFTHPNLLYLHFKYGSST